MPRKNRRDIYDDPQPFARAPSLEEADAALYGVIDGLDEALTEALSDEQRSALKIVDESTLQFKRVSLTSTGMLVPQDITEDDMSELGDVLLRMQRSIQWWLGDWLNAMEDREWGETYNFIASKYEYEVESLHNIASICKRVEISRRRETLSFGHHDAVAALTPSKQLHWLNYAEKHRASVRELRRAIKDAKAGKHVSALTLFRRRYRSFAEKQRQSAAEASAEERREMANLLRELADEIEQG